MSSATLTFTVTVTDLSGLNEFNELKFELIEMNDTQWLTQSLTNQLLFFEPTDTILNSLNKPQEYCSYKTYRWNLYVLILRLDYWFL